MKNYSRLLLVFMLSASVCFAQPEKYSELYNFVVARQQTAALKDVSLFIKTSKQISSVNNLVAEKQVLLLQKAASIALHNEAPSNIRLQIPAAGRSYSLQLVKEPIHTAADLSYGTLDNNGTKQQAGLATGLHYRGYISGDPTSIASFSVFSNGDVMCLFSGKDGNFNLGRIDQLPDDYLLYNSRDLKATLGFSCSTLDVPEGESLPTPPSTTLRVQAPPVLCKKVRLYWEGDYKLYVNNFNSNLTNTANYLTGLFNQVAVMFANEGITIELSDLFIWTTPNTYNNSTSSNGLNSFKGRWNGLGNTFKGDLAVLIDGAPTNNGGIAYLLKNNLCNRTFAYGYANVYGYYYSVPTYSWDVEVVTHEMGHMMGSNHTQWCGWNTGTGGTCGAIDDCYTLEKNGCDTCPVLTSTNPTPPVGFKGTVMSYCHLRGGIGINLADGFGPLPQNAIRTTVNNASCAVFNNTWTGTVNNAWEEAANWSCGIIPTATTDVTIPGGLTNYPIVNSAAVCRRINYQPGSNIIINPGFKLSVLGNTGW